MESIGEVIDRLYPKLNKGARPDLALTPYLLIAAKDPACQGPCALIGRGLCGTPFSKGATDLEPGAAAFGSCHLPGEGARGAGPGGPPAATGGPRPQGRGGGDRSST